MMLNIAMGFPSTSAADHLAATASITRLPAEITTKIFKDVIGMKRMDKTARLAFQALRCVCSQWRTTCFSTLEFWSALSIFVSVHSNKWEGIKPSRYGQLIGKWFPRSGPKFRLEMELLQDEDGIPMSTDDKQEVVRFIVEHQPRWKYLSLPIRISDYWNIYAYSPPDKWRLETLVLSFRQHPAGTNSKDGKPSPLDQITTLKKLVLQDMTPSRAGDITHLAHPGLTDLHLFTHCVKLTHFKLLANWTHLVNLSIQTVPETNHSRPEQYPQLSLPHLKSLNLETDDLKPLSHLNCRELANFRLVAQAAPKINRWGTAPNRLKPQALSDFLSRAPDTLSRITIEGGPVSDTVLARLLGGLSVCTSKNLTVVAIDRWPSAGEPIPVDCCPNLYELRVGGQIGWVSLGDTAGIARTRRFTEFVNAKLDREGSKLKELVVEKVPFMVCFPFELLETLEGKGLKVTVMLSPFTL
ncbi:hypothetical protein BKA70DRAFT_1283525 [Coprinopsis sp. MPI-PUGE-AT-0042]|nr:hypothetical protein BKA70DRAFT_1283525 [Coprinopsis sp. MPI-PUGE-AT-0042]